MPARAVQHHVSYCERRSSIPNAVSSGQDPLIGDQGATTGVIKAGATLVLERYLKYEGNEC